MLLALPRRVPWIWTFAFLGVLCTMLLLNGSDPLMVLLAMAYITLAVDAFNRVGGLQYPSGAYIFWNTTLVAIVGIVVKTVTWEPLQNNLLTPRKTFTVLVATNAGIWVAAYVNSRLRARKGLMRDVVKPEMVRRLVIGCFFSALFVAFVINFSGNENGSVASALNQVNRLTPLSIIFAVYYEVKGSGGYRSLSLLGGVAIFYTFLQGVSGYTKEGMFIAFLCWGAAAVAAGYRISKVRLIAVMAVAAFVLPALTAYSQYGRAHHDEFGGGPIDNVIYVLTHRSELIERADSSVADLPVNNAFVEYHFFDKPRGIFDRINMVAPDDGLIQLTDTSHIHGWGVLWAYLYNILPHFLAPDKPTLNVGNGFAHEMGMLQADDLTTGISFSLAGECYHIAGWAGVIFIIPVALFIFFCIADSITGPADRSPWELFYLVTLSHVAPEGGLGGLIFLSTIGFLQLLFSIVVCVYIAPLIGTLVIGPEKNSRGRFTTIAPLARRETLEVALEHGITGKPLQ